MNGNWTWYVQREGVSHPWPTADCLRAHPAHPLEMSGEDQRHTNHEEQVELVVSRVILPDGRIVETTTSDPPENPPNVIRGNNEGL